jgi:hypothetical protein
LQIISRSLEREVTDVKFHRHRRIPAPEGQEYQREAANQSGFGVTVGSEGLRSGAPEGAASKVEISLLSNYPERRREKSLSVGASPLMQERRINRAL